MLLFWFQFTREGSVGFHRLDGVGLTYVLVGLLMFSLYQIVDPPRLTIRHASGMVAVVLGILIGLHIGQRHLWDAHLLSFGGAPGLFSETVPLTILHGTFVPYHSPVVYVVGLFLVAVATRVREHVVVFVIVSTLPVAAMIDQQFYPGGFGWMTGFVIEWIHFTFAVFYAIPLVYTGLALSTPPEEREETLAWIRTHLPG